MEYEDKAITGGSWIETFSGARIDPYHPHPEEIFLIDIAHALSNICRFTGHSKVFYSVAQHSLLVSWLVEEKFKKEALFHDAGEAYMNDLARPIKTELNYYVQSEHMLREMIFQKFGIPIFDHAKISPEVKEADDVALIYEATLLGFRWGAERLTDQIKARIEALSRKRAADAWPMPNSHLTPMMARQQYIRALQEYYTIETIYGRN
jgi:hypothetical protein